MRTGRVPRWWIQRVVKVGEDMLKFEVLVAIIS
jgi:hypothetical protein